MKRALTILGMAALYVLTFPVVAWSVLKVPKSSTTRPTPATIRPSLPPWLKVYGAPYAWLRETPLKGALDTYSHDVTDRLQQL